MLDDSSAEALTHSFTLGITRQKPKLAVLGGLVPDEPRAVLAALALLGQRRRFQRPPAVTVTPAEPGFADSRPTLPEAARKLLVSLLSGKGGDTDDPIAQAIADTIARAGYKLHPFDLPLLDTFVSAEAERLGASAVAWAERRAPAEERRGTSLFLDTIDESNWTQGRPAQKAAFIRTIRARDPDRARSLVESVFAGELAPARLALLRALSEHLSPSDLPFLEGIAKDRAPTVREAAAALLARVPGSAHSAARIKECLSRIERERAGLLRRRTRLKLGYPATVKPEAREDWACTAFTGLPLEGLAEGLGLSVEDMLDEAAEDPVLTLVFTLLAAEAGRYDLVRRLVEAGAVLAWERMVWLPDFQPSDPDAWSEAALRPERWPALPNAVGRLYHCLRMPLPAPLFTRLLDAHAGRSFLAEIRAAAQDSADKSSAHRLSQGGDLDALTASLAALAPASARARLRQALNALPPGVAHRARVALTLLDIIEPA